jgi:hypothetical protein
MPPQKRTPKYNGASGIIAGELLSYKASSEWNPVPFGKYITGTDRPYCSRKDSFKLDAAFNARYAVEYHVFAIILALCRARIINNPIRQLYSLSYCAYSCLIGLIINWSRLRAMNLAKSLIILEKTFSIIAHLCSEMAVFGRRWAQIFSSGKPDWSDTQEQSMPFNST